MFSLPGAHDSSYYENNAVLHLPYASSRLLYLSRLCSTDAEREYIHLQNHYTCTSFAV